MSRETSQTRIAAHCHDNYQLNASSGTYHTSAGRVHEDCLATLQVTDVKQQSLRDRKVQRDGDRILRWASRVNAERTYE